MERIHQDAVHEVCGSVFISVRAFCSYLSSECGKDKGCGGERMEENGCNDSDDGWA